MFGDFEGLCKGSALPVCTLFRPEDITYEDWVTPKCKTRLYSAGSAHILNLADLVVTAVIILLAAYCVIKTHERLAAVGRREMALLFSVYLLGLVLNFVGNDFLFDSDVANKWLSVANVTLVVSFFWLLILVGLVGFQLLPDGSAFSILSMLISTTVIFIGIGYIAADTAFGVTNTLKPGPDMPFYSPGLYFVYLVFPLISIFIYFVTQAVIVFRYLAVRKPLLWLIGAIVTFALSQIFMLVISDNICDGTNGRIDGTMFSTLLNFVAMVFIYYFWNSITEDKSVEFFDGPMVGK
ncbi:hypothetical protein EV182_004302 [Spiromyces aspiralis]|uniref:Uncharacterized protein n=1 Tax=Spiromyces aspiralis TaxID=68401 RepID=A0ACC1HBG7_9FUNG|nr:hypothetical protein EV182_004302 [Spiromyces aspiralis]